MQVVAHSSPLVLEQEVLGRVAAAKQGDPAAPVLVVVPSRRLADHIARRLVERLGVVLGVEIVHHAALARRIVESAGIAAPRTLAAPLADTLMRLVVRGASAGRLRDYFRERPSAMASLLRPLDDLREAGISPAEARSALGGEGAELVALYERWTEALEAARERGAADPTAIARLAIAHAGAYAARFRAVIHHGAYDLIGVHADLLRALDSGREVAMLLPAPRDDASATLPVKASFLHAQGSAAELVTAARGALAAVLDGVPPEETAVVVRSFGPYAAAMDALLDTEDVDFHTSFTQPLLRDPAVASLLRAISAMEPERSGSYAEHAIALAPVAAGSPELAALVDVMADVETVLGESQAVLRSEAVAWLASRVEATMVPPARTSDAGIRILDAMQARGLTFRHVALAGMNAGVFPRVGREDPFLSDAARARLSEATGRPLPRASQRDAEEHLLLDMILSSARERLSVSWRRADEAGRPVVPSLALSDVARATGTGAVASAVQETAVALPAHPRARLAAWASHPGLLRRDEETVLVALQSEAGGAAVPAVMQRVPEWTRGIELVTATDGFAPGAGAYDGRVGPGFVRREIAATALQRLGVCPLQFFFRDVLRVKVEPEAKTPFEAASTAVGERVHQVLGDVYRALRAEEAFERLALPARLTRAVELLRTAWPERANDKDGELARSFPILEGIAAERWIATLADFLAADLARLDREELVPVAIEHEVSGSLPGASDTLVVKARLDRIAEGPSGRVIGEYKTGGSLPDRIAMKAMLSGASIQIPLYAALEGVSVELLGVGLKHRPEPGTDPDPRFARFDGFKNDAQREGMRETLAILARLAEDGRFPLRAGRHCGWCEFSPACRRHHPPTDHREGLSPDVADARDCWEKGSKMPTLASVRDAAEAR